jgi:hypothetical protein
MGMLFCKRIATGLNEAHAKQRTMQHFFALGFHTHAAQLSERSQAKATPIAQQYR